jgi:hypothetical protein
LVNNYLDGFIVNLIKTAEWSEGRIFKESYLLIIILSPLILKSILSAQDGIPLVAL